MHTRSGKLSWTMAGNGLFIILYLAVAVANSFGFAAWTPPAELVVIAPAVVAVINLLLRYFRTAEPIDRGEQDAQG